MEEFYKTWRDFVDEVFEMGVDKGETGKQPLPRGPLRPERPLERPWPTPTPGIPIPRRSEENRTLKQIMDKLTDIEKRLERIEKTTRQKAGIKSVEEKDVQKQQTEKAS